MKKYIAFDIGDKRIGIAVSDPLGSMALPVETYHRKNFAEDIAYLVKKAEERCADEIVCGLPLNFDGTDSEQTTKTRSFIAEIEKNTKIPVVAFDERFSTLEAHRVLIVEDMSRKNRKKVVDAVAASFILEDYMRKVAFENARK